jgi:hypothetical protein
MDLINRDYQQKGYDVTNKYTPAVVAELQAIGTPLTYDGAVAFGLKHGIPFRSVIAKARALTIDYKPKAPGSRNAAEKGPLKADLVTTLEKAFGISAPSLAKMTVPDLI